MAREPWVRERSCLEPYQSHRCTHVPAWVREKRLMRVWGECAVCFLSCGLGRAEFQLSGVFVAFDVDFAPWV